jgi:hypothetical protein
MPAAYEMNLIKLAQTKSRSNSSHWLTVRVVLSTLVFALSAWPAFAVDGENEQPFWGNKRDYRING